jgi:hypothetical protein
LSTWVQCEHMEKTTVNQKLQEIVTDVAIGMGYSPVSIQTGKLAHLRRNKRALPMGKFDNAERFKLTERCACCEQIREPSRAFPAIELQHGRTDKHIATRFSVPVAEVKKIREAFEIADSYTGTQLSEHDLIRLSGKVREKLRRTANKRASGKS